MAAPHSRQTLKAERESRLQWQSRSLLLLVLLTSVAGFLSQVWAYRTPATAEGIAICAAFGLLVWLVRAATPLAAATGFVLTGCMYLGTVAQPGGGFFHTALLPGLALLVLAFAATRFRRGHKEQVGLAESRRGRRASQVAANMGAAALAVLSPPNSSWLRPAFGRYAFSAPILFTPLVAALAEAAADTVSSEIGQAIGGTPFLLTTGKRVPPGTDGAISLAGTAAGCVAAAIVALTAMPTLRLDPRKAAVVWLAAIAGLFADSLIGATLESRGWLNNDLVNFVSTAIAALLAAMLASSL